MDPDRQTLSLMKRLCLSLLFLSTIAWSCGNPQRSANSKDSTANGHTAGGSDAGMLLVANKADATLYFINTETLELIDRSEEHTSELQSLMRISYAVFCLKKKNHKTQ